MREKPILFSGPMVRAILEGRKTQTRRVMKRQPTIPRGRYSYDGKGDGTHWLERVKKGEYTEKYFPCEKPPYVPGDRLWVRETFRTVQDEETGAERFIYRADDKEKNPYARWVPSIHMPRSLSRITLEVTDVRVERLKDISEEDALAEGIFKSIREEDGLLLCTDARFENERLLVCAEAVKVFEYEWEFIYGPCSWEANPWVWVIGFKVAEVNK